MRRALLLTLLCWAGVPAVATPVTGRTVLFAGKVVDADGRPAGGASVFVSIADMRPTLRDRSPAWTQVRTAAGADGSFRLSVPVRREDWLGQIVASQAGHGPGGQDVRAGTLSTGLRLALTRPSFVAGRVVDRAGHPVAEAKVRVAWGLRPDQQGVSLPPDDDRPAASTDAEGRFRIGSLPDRCRVVLEVLHPRYASWMGFEEPIHSGASDARIVLPAAGTVLGRVVYEDGRPAADVGVRRQGYLTPEARTDASGSFRMTRLAPGYQVLTAELPGAAPEFAADPQGVVLEEGAEVRVPDLRLVRGGVISGKITDDQGQPIAGIFLSSQRDYFFPTLNMRTQAAGPCTETRVDGTYRLRLPPGKWAVLPIFVPDGYVTEAMPGSEPARVVADGGTVRLDLRFYRTALRGRVVNSHGQAAAGARVRAEVRRGNYGFREDQTADAAGYFTLGRFLPRDSLRLTARSRDGSEAARTDVGPGRVTTRSRSSGTAPAGRELVIRLQPLPTVTGVVRDRGGRPVAGATVRVDRIAFEGHQGPEDEGAASTDARGRFRLPILPGAHLRVAVEAPGFGPADRYPVVAERGKATRPLSFVLERAAGFVAGVVVDAEDRPLAGAKVSAMRLGATNVYLFARDVTTDARGRFRVENLSPGEVRLLAQRAGYETDARDRVPVGAANVRLILPPMADTAARPSLLATGSRAPEIAVSRWVNGTGVQRLSDLRTKTVVLQFSSAYNRAARTSNESLKQLHAALRAKSQSDVVILALYDASAGAEEVAAYAAAEALPFAIGLMEETRNLGADSGTFRAYGVREQPTVFIIDGDGIVRAVNPTPEALVRLAGS